MSYVTVDELRDYLTQVPAGAANDALLQTMLDRATAMIDLELGFSFAGHGAATAKDVRGAADSQWLYPPAYLAGSITTIVEVYSKGMSDEDATEAITEYDLDEDSRPYGIYKDDRWTNGRWYRITAKWGGGPTPPAIGQLCLEVARDLWQAKAGNMSSATVNVDGAGAATVQYAWTHRQYQIIQQTRRQFGHFGVS